KLSEEEMRAIRGREISMIFQEPMTSLNPVLTIGFQIMEPLMIHLGMSEEQARARAAELMRQVGIPDGERRLDQYPHQFSGGMRQRVMIAIGLACNPNLIIADEPTTALDVTIQAQILELMKSLSRDLGIALIIITHNLGIVARYAPRVVVTYSGRVRQRVMIAIGRACNPKLFIADELTAALDVIIQVQILDLMKSLSRDLGIALISITHNLGIVARYAHRVVVMYYGRVVEQGEA